MRFSPGGPTTGSRLVVKTNKDQVLIVHVHTLIETDLCYHAGQISEKCGYPRSLTDAILPNSNDDKSICVTECPRRHKLEDLEGSFILCGVAAQTLEHLGHIKSVTSVSFWSHQRNGTHLCEGNQTCGGKQWDREHGEKTSMLSGNKQKSEIERVQKADAAAAPIPMGQSEEPRPKVIPTQASYAVWTAGASCPDKMLAIMYPNPIVFSQDEK
ncbi:Hypothetical predicted protein [Scomber scombrus]|uniref:Uncharacterized protein n=1 Tax=Scomber scombrus TaxID=13677 RepID=A0AAV1NVL0_SCOSC